MKNNKEKTDTQKKADTLRKYGGIPEGGLDDYWKIVGEKRSFYGNNKKGLLSQPGTQLNDSGDGAVESENKI